MLLTSLVGNPFRTADLLEGTVPHNTRKESLLKPKPYFILN